MDEYIYKHYKKISILLQEALRQISVTVLITDYTDRYILLETMGYNKNKFSFVKGSIEEGETAEMTVERELYEEIGVFL